MSKRLTTAREAEIRQYAGSAGWAEEELLAELDAVRAERDEARSERAALAKTLLDCERLLGGPMHEAPGERRNWNPRTHYEQWAAIVQENARLTAALHRDAVSGRKPRTKRLKGK